jgi:hypothetical protein
MGKTSVIFACAALIESARQIGAHRQVGDGSFVTDF